MIHDKPNEKLREKSFNFCCCVNFNLHKHHVITGHTCSVTQSKRQNTKYKNQQKHDDKYVKNSTKCLNAC